ncbi:hypothetical protein [Mycobacterium sp. 155]|uniref:WXG100-like domain-containing protein n=1 Tax=Mycobacterium sp. 155 TaxID=1157943 RepID=UPI0012F9C40C|nr:hypothetical protein [Mycobacterium sp. 155]
MSIQKPDDPYGMAAPPAWPEADEDALETLSQTFKNAASTVRRQVESTQHEQAMMFAGAALWSGAAAGAAHSALGQRITDLQNLATELQAACDLLHACSEAVKDAKKQISNNVESANEDIGSVKGDENIEDDDKKRYIQQKIQDTKNTNIALIQAEAKFISGAQSKPDLAHYEVKRDQGSRNITRVNNLMNNGAPTLPVNNIAGTPPNPSATNPGKNPSPGAAVPGDGEPALPVSNIAGTPPNPSATNPGKNPAPVAPVPGEPALPAANVFPEPVATTPQIPSVPGAGRTPPPPPTPATGSPVPGPAGAPGVPRLDSPGSPGIPSQITPQMMGSTGQPLTPQQQLNDFTRAMSNAAQQAPLNQPFAGPQTGGLGPSSAPVNPAASLQPPPSAPAAPADSAPAAPSGGGASPSAPPVNSNLNVASGPTPSMPLGPAPSLPTAGTPAPGPMGPAVAPASTSSNASSNVAPAPVPVTAARAERDAIAAAQTANALRRKQAGNDPLQLARRIAAALNASPSIPKYGWGFVWATGLTVDGGILVANSYGIAYIPDEVNLPEQVRMVSADESIPASDRAKWATYPFLALQDWAQHQGVRLQAVVGTQEQLTGIDPGVTKMVLDESDIPEDGRMQGRSRLEIIAPDAAAMLAATSDSGLTELLPPRPADDTAPADKSQSLWRELQKPLMRTTEGREVAHLEAFINYANHQGELALHRAHIASSPDEQRAAIADWVYWQHISVLISDSLVPAG